MRICYFSSSRADFGISSILLKKMEQDSKIDLHIVYSGSHLKKDRGETENEIKNLNFKQIYKLKINSPSTIKNISEISLGFFKIINKIKPDLLLILGDRYETFASAFTAYTCNIPIGHIHGGETSVGSMDEQFRHSITKFSQIHFTSTSIYKKRVIQLGENPLSVFNVGSLSLDAKKNMRFHNKVFFENKYKILFRKKNFIVTYHPNTKNHALTNIELKILLSSINEFNDICFIFTAANLDFGGDYINRNLRIFCKKNQNCFFIPSFGINELFSLYKIINGVIGNSSSGVIEAPSFNIPILNLGDRQAGRIKSKSVIDLKFDKKEIVKRLKKIVNSKIIFKNKNPYEKSNSSDNIINLIKNNTKIFKKNIKVFYDLK